MEFYLTRREMLADLQCDCMIGAVFEVDIHEERG
jgi:hypothetical protein